mgnify:CR=1 FL=1
MAKRKKNCQVSMRCPYCGRPVQLRPTAYVYGEDNLHPQGLLYVCTGYPDACDAYVGAHKKSMQPMGTLASSELRHKRIEAHRALKQIWLEGYMTKHGTYIWLQNRLCLREKDMHIGMFSEYRCEETIRECNILMEQYAKTNRSSSCEKKIMAA